MNLMKTLKKTEHKLSGIWCKTLTLPGVVIADIDSDSEIDKTYWVNKSDNLVFYFDDSIGFTDPEQLALYMETVAEDHPDRFEFQKVIVDLNTTYIACRMWWD